MAKASSKKPDKADTKPEKKAAKPAKVEAKPNVDQEEARKRGRPSEYDNKFAMIAEALCMFGATDEEIAAHFKVSVRTIHRWKLEHEEFCHALKNGKNLPDERVERSLYQRSLGTYVIEEQAIKVKVGPSEEKVEIVKVEKYVPPDTTAMIFWLKNRRSKDWKDVKQHEVGGPGDFSNMTDEELVRERERVKREIEMHMTDERTIN